MGIWYKKSRDGEIGEYVAQCREFRIPKIFRGSKQFKELVNLRYILENITTIRIMYNIDRYDESYAVTDNFQLEGLIFPAHSGQKGIHKPEALFKKDTPYYEVDMMNPHPKALEEDKRI